MCFVWIWEQTAIISLYNINWLVFITETECVYCAVRTDCLKTIKENVAVLRTDWQWVRFVCQYFSFPCQYHSTIAPYSSVYHPRYIMFFSRYISFPLSVSFHHCSILIRLPPALYNVFLPVHPFSPVSIIPPLLHTHPSISHPRSIMFFSQYFSFPLSVSFHHCSILIHPSTTHAV